jgi:cell division protein FtsX
VFKHSILEGAKNLIRSFWLSITAIFIIFVSLTSVALVTSMWVATGIALRKLDTQAVLFVYLNKDIDPELKSSMNEDLKNYSEIKSVEFINKQQAEESFRNY